MTVYWLREPLGGEDAGGAIRGGGEGEYSIVFSEGVESRRDRARPRSKLLSSTILLDRGGDLLLELGTDGEGERRGEGPLG